MLTYLTNSYGTVTTSRSSKRGNNASVNSPQQCARHIQQVLQLGSAYLPPLLVLSILATMIGPGRTNVAAGHVHGGPAVYAPFSVLHHPITGTPLHVQRDGSVPQLPPGSMAAKQERLEKNWRY